MKYVLASISVGASIGALVIAALLIMDWIDEHWGREWKA